MNFNLPRLKSATGNAAGEQVAKQLRKQGDEVKPHRSNSVVWLPVDHYPPGSQIDLIDVHSYKRDHPFY